MSVQFEKATNYQAMVKAAEAFAILTNGVGKPKLVEQLNAKMAEVGEEEFLRRAALVVNEAGKIVIPETAPKNAAAEAQAPETGKAAATPAATNGKPATNPGQSVTVSAKKWYEGVQLPYAADEIVEVTGGILKGRQMQVTRPAPGKVDAMKGHMINETTGALQNTEVTIDLVNLAKAASQTPRLKNAPTSTPTPAPAVTSAPIEKTDPVVEAPETPESLKEEKQEQENQA